VFRAVGFVLMDLRVSCCWICAEGFAFSMLWFVLLDLRV